MSSANDIEQTKTRRGIAVVVAVFMAGLAWVAAESNRDPKPRINHPAIIDSAYIVFALWAGAALLMIQTKRANWIATSGPFRVVRLTWTLAIVMYLVHMAVAFHFGHRWQHANAWDHVQSTSGFGPGIFVSYGFTLVWLLDVLWLNLRPGSHASRSAKLGYLWHGSFAFIMFNATVVYGHGPMRIVSGAVMAFLGVYWIWIQLVSRDAKRSA